jgi:adenosine deaminase
MIKKAHIGEFSDAESIKKMIESFELNEVQHGITAVNSKEVINYLIKNKIQLNICPFSNISLGAIDNIKNHPIRHLFDSGVKLTINTDDLLFFDKSNSEQYYELIKNKMFTEKEIDRIRLNSLRLEEQS